MTRSLVKAVVALLTCAVLCGLLWRGATVCAQLAGLGTGEGFDASEYYEAPDHLKLKWRISGAKAQPQDRGRILLSGMQLQLFAKTGERRVLIEAPECLYDSVKRTANSAGRLKAQVDEGRFTIEGRGFLWQQTGPTNSLLTLSNDIRSVVQHARTNASGVVTSSMMITSRRFEFDTARLLAEFRESVHADDPELELNCERLIASAAPGTGTFETIVAETQVTVASKADGRSATADRAVYTRTNETMRLTGGVTWKQGSQAGRAERVAIQWVEKAFEADGQVAVKLPRQSLGLEGLLTRETSNAAPTTNPAAPIDLSADHLQVSSNLTVIAGSVRIRDETNQLSCDKLVIESVATNEAGQTAIAEGHVVVCHGSEDQCLRSDRAVFTKATGAAVFTGQPTWKLSPSEGRANRVTVQRSGEIQANGDVAARVTLPPQSHSFLILFPGAADTNPAPRVIEVFSRDLSASERQVALRGDARVHQSPITGSEPHLQCETIDLFFATNTHRIELVQASNRVRFAQGTAGVTNGPDAYRGLTADRFTASWSSPTGELSSFVAEQNVTIDAPDTKGQPSHATADKLTYNYAVANGVTNKAIELTGNPQLTNAMGRLVGDVIVWDLLTDRFYTRNYRVNVSAGTNVVPRDFNKDFTKPAKRKK